MEPRETLHEQECEQHVSGYHCGARRILNVSVRNGDLEMPELKRVSYEDLNARQRESFNFAKVSAVLADYGFATIRLTDDWQGADFIAQHMDGQTFLKIQLKGRAVFYKKYMGKDLHIAFPSSDAWYVYPHDQVLEQMLAQSNIANTESWIVHGRWVFPSLTKQLAEILQPFKVVP